MIDAWWERWPDANVGLATGHVFDVVDLDGPEGEAMLDRWWAEKIPFLSPNVTCMLLVGTPGRGQHWYIKAVPGASNRARKLPGVDYRGAGGLAAAPPSVHRSGGRYEWLTPPDQGVLLAPPDQLVELFTGSERRSETHPGVVRLLDPERGDGTRYGLAAVRSACDRIAGALEGARNDTLNREAVPIYGLVAGGQLLEHVADEWLAAAAQAAGLGERETTRTLASAKSAGLRQPRTRPGAA